MKNEETPTIVIEIRAGLLESIFTNVKGLDIHYLSVDEKGRPYDDSEDSKENVKAIRKIADNLKESHNW